MEFRQVRTAEKCPGCGGTIYQQMGTIRAFGGDIVTDDVPGPKSCDGGCRLISDVDGNIQRAIPR